MLVSPHQDLPLKIIQLIVRGALFVVNHSGGKDSQAMLIRLRQAGVPNDQLLIVHADLGRVEWAGSQEHIKRTAFGLPLLVATARRSFFQMVRERGKWPSPQQRQCTSDLKRGPIAREIRRYLKTHPRYNNLVVNCMGMRAQESAARAKAQTLKFSERNSRAGREWYDWLPIHAMTETEVFQTIRDAGQAPAWPYFAGMTRYSCCFCIMASEADLKTAARLAPDLYREVINLERDIGHTLSMSQRPLDQVTGIAA